MARSLWLAPLVLILGCQTGEEVNTRSLSEAKRQWQRAAVRDYNLVWKTSGPRSGLYRVFVRGGEVRAIRSVLEDGREIEPRPGDKSYYSVDGLFRVIDEELAQLLEERPFGQPKGTRVLLRFERDPEYGFPRQYRRDVAGLVRGLVLDVLEFVPNPPSEIPPLGEAAETGAATRPAAF